MKYHGLFRGELRPSPPAGNKHLNGGFVYKVNTKESQNSKALTPGVMVAMPRSGTRLALATLLMAGACAMAQETGAAPEMSAPLPKDPPPAVAAQKKYTVPAGTKVLLSMKSAVNTKTAKAGDGVYLESTFPVVSEGRIVIPAGVYVKGVVDQMVRPGRIKGKAQVSMHFTTIIFPNGTTVEVPGQINSLPGSAGPALTGDEGTVQAAGSKGKDAADIAKATAAGAGLGGIAGISAENPAASLGYGALGGAVAGVLYTLFTRGAEVSIPQGTPIEMVLRRPLVLEEQQVAVAAGPSSPALAPAQDQPAPMQKPSPK